MELEGASLESLRVVKFPRSHAEGADLEGGGLTRGRKQIEFKPASAVSGRLRYVAT
jgi:hypothetical protein